MIEQYLRDRVNNDRKHVLSLLVAGDCNKDICLNKVILNQEPCKDCKERINHEIGQDSKESYSSVIDSFTKIRLIFGFKPCLKEGCSFILNVPPRSFHNLKRKKNRLRAYREIVKYKMRGKNITKFSPDSEIKLSLCFCIQQYYTTSDCDNMAKSICDALEGILYHRDSQIQRLICQKFRVPSRSDEAIVVSFKKV